MPPPRIGADHGVRHAISIGEPMAFLALAQRVFDRLTRTDVADNAYECTAADEVEPTDRDFDGHRRGLVSAEDSPRTERGLRFRPTREPAAPRTPVAVGWA